VGMFGVVRDESAARSIRRRRAVNPYTGQTIGKSDPMWHMDWGP
jgi:hypothetical protein